MGRTLHFIAADTKTLHDIMSGNANLFSVSPLTSANIDKSWQVLRYLFCKDAEDDQTPMCYVIPMREESFIECNVELGTFCLTEEEVQEVSRYLSTISNIQIKKPFI